MAADRLTWNTAGVTSEVFDDEVVIVNFESGKYHSLQGSACIIWQWLEGRPTLEELMERAATTFAPAAGEIPAGVKEFIDTLLAEGLVVWSEGVSQPTTPGPRSQEPSNPTFAAPVLNTFSDMQELLLLDPIHEVDAAGWPVARDTQES